MVDNEYKKLLANVFEGVYIVNPDRQILFWNKGSGNITGYNSSEIVGTHCFNNILDHVDADGRHLCHDGCPLHRTLRTGDELEAEVFLRHKQGHRVPVKVRTMPITDTKGEVVAAVEVFSDNNYREDLLVENRRLQELSITDPLTGLYNRRYMEFQLQSSIDEADVFQRPFGVLFIDIDHFKRVNDAYGHQVGDEVLKLVASTINSNIRKVDCFGRWGGEEFILIVRGVQPQHLMKVAEKHRVLVENSQLIDSKGRTITVTVSIGGTPFVEKMTSKELVDRADANMYEAKHNGRNNVLIK